MRQCVRKYVTHCIICISNRKIPRAPLQSILSWAKPSMPFDTLHTDVLGPLRLQICPYHISRNFVCCTLFIEKIVQSLNAFLQIPSDFGTPRLIVCDGGRMFQSE